MSVIGLKRIMINKLENEMYNYLVEKPKIFTEQGQKEFLKVRDRAKKLLNE